ncbi:AraC family transcriptional regulator [Aureimonas pseudogalii]|uniref:AraC-like DNA-binding protein n=1 Tax=Aureimonas pseudogalii TaxID=1744844 RepID=A0A7W6H968_9HYPH|nr:AraC family transcriptional regulator [Aureimonas pseudogalii]MBB4000688.1 AraC-like DNA-binding protein [Aureimonas pseudogalii]
MSTDLKDAHAEKGASSERLPFVRLNSQELTPDAAFKQWQALLPQYSIRLPVGHDIRDFAIDASAWLLDPLVVMAGQSTTAWVDRVVRGGKMDEANQVFVVFAEGRWAGEADGRPFDFGDGELIGLDTGRPSVGLSTNSRWIMINVPQRALAKLMPSIPDIHGHVFRSASAAFLADHMIAMARHLPRMQVDETERITRATLSLIASALDELTFRTKTNEAFAPSAIRRRVERHIQQNLAATDLSPKSISEKLGITRSTLYRAFSPIGGIAAVISEHRLDTARAILFHPEDHRSISEIANLLGYRSTATFSKAFNRRFGCYPRVARATGTTRERMGGRLLFHFWEDVLTKSCVDADDRAAIEIWGPNPKRVDRFQ